jgi:hypothetical protein
VQADLIGTAKETRFDARVREVLHKAWEAAEDAAAMQDIVRGLKYGFKRRRPGGVDEEEEVGRAGGGGEGRGTEAGLGKAGC